MARRNNEYQIKCDNNVLYSGTDRAEFIQKLCMCKNMLLNVYICDRSIEGYLRRHKISLENPCSN